MFHYANNFIDRLATSNEAQATRDIAETILMIGHQENMEAEGYFCASRAYTIQNNSVAGLFYMEIALKNGRNSHLLFGTSPHSRYYGKS